jgi:hypothetical protein
MTDPDALLKALLERERELRRRHRIWQALTLASVMAPSSRWPCC